MLVATFVAVFVAVFAIADHRQTRGRIDRADISNWFCKYQQSHCDEPKPGPIHDRWVFREYLYKAAEGLVAVAFAVASLRLLRIRRLR